MTDTSDTSGQPGDSGPEERFPRGDGAVERAVLGAMLQWPDALAASVEALRIADFQYLAHQLVFAAAADLHTRGEGADPITVASELTKRDEIDRIGGADFLHTLLSSVTTSANVDSHIKLVKQRSLLRQLADAGTRIVRMSRAAADGDAAKILHRAQAELLALADPARGPSIEDQIRDALDEIENAGSHGKRLTSVPTGFADLDALTGGLRPGQVHTVFGATGIGSSTLALDFTRSAAIKHNLTTAFFSGQSPANEIINRILAAEARVASHTIRAGTMQDQDWTRVARRMPEIAEAPLHVRDSPRLTFDEIHAECRRLKHHRDLRLIVIDGVNLYARPTAPESLWAAQVRLSADIKRMAVELGVPIITTVPTNRRAENRFDPKPTLPDIASSSAYAADADVVIGIHRDDAYDRESPRAGEADLLVLKNRHGPVSTVTVAFQGHYSRFVDMAL